MTNFEQDVAELQREAQQLAQERDRAEAQYAAHDEAYERAMARLRSEFDVDSIEAAEALLGSADQELAAEIVRVRAALAAARKPEDQNG